MGHFCPPGSGSTDLIESGSATLVFRVVLLQSHFGSGAIRIRTPDPAERFVSDQIWIQIHNNVHCIVPYFDVVSLFNLCEYCVQVFSRASDQESCGWWRAIVKMIKGDFHVVEYLGNNFYAVLRRADPYSFISKLIIY